MDISPLDILLMYEVKTLELHRSNNSLSSAALFERSNKPQISSLERLLIWEKAEKLCFQDSRDFRAASPDVMVKTGRK